MKQYEKGIKNQDAEEPAGDEASHSQRQTKVLSVYQRAVLLGAYIVFNKNPLYHHYAICDI